MLEVTRALGYVIDLDATLVDGPDRISATLYRILHHERMSGPRQTHDAPRTRPRALQVKARTR